MLQSLHHFFREDVNASFTTHRSHLLSRDQERYLYGRSFSQIKGIGLRPCISATQK